VSLLHITYSQQTYLFFILGKRKVRTAHSWVREMIEETKILVDPLDLGINYTRSGLIIETKFNCQDCFDEL
jgi:hypothetical protein